MELIATADSSKKKQEYDPVMKRIYNTAYRKRAIAGRNVGEKVTFLIMKYVNQIPDEMRYEFKALFSKPNEVNILEYWKKQWEKKGIVLK